MDRRETEYRSRIYASYLSASGDASLTKIRREFQARLPYLRHLVRTHFPPTRDTAVLDLGCGHGGLLHVLKQEAYTNVRGVDGSSQQVMAARKLGINEVEQGDIFVALSSRPSESVDIVVTLDVIEHLTKSELLAFVDQVWSVLRPKGRWIIHTANAEGLFSAKVRFDDFTHELAFTRGSLSQVLWAGGFVDLHFFEDRPIVHGLPSLVRALLWRIARAFLVAYVAIETGRVDWSAVFTQNLMAVAFKPARGS